MAEIGGIGQRGASAGYGARLATTFQQASDKRDPGSGGALHSLANFWVIAGGEEPELSGVFGMACDDSLK